MQWQIRRRHERDLPGNIEVEDVPCPCCGNSAAFKVRYRPYVSSPIRIVECERCALMFLRPMPTERFYDRFYSNEYMGNLVRNRAKAAAAGNATYRSFSARAERIGTMLAPYLGAKARPVVLEIGAAHGFNLVAAGVQAPAAQLYENEIDRRWASMYAEQRIANWQARPAGTLADILIFSHVVEHFRDPLAGLKAQRENLIADGVVYIEVPNVPTGDQPYLPFKLAHTMYFSPETLTAVANRAGFENIVMRPSDVIVSLWRRKP